MRRRDFLQTSGSVLGGMALGAGLAPASAEAVVTPRRGGTLIWGHSETTENLDIDQTGTASTLRLLQNIHDSIVTVDYSFKVIPNVAEHFEASEDLLSYTFHIRPGVKFHNGAPVTSADVKYSFERVKDPKTGAVNYAVFNAVKSIETPDSLTVVVTMSQVYAPFLQRLAEIGAGAVIPKDSGPLQGKAPIGCGPFKFVSREFGNKAVLQRFDDYWQGPAYLDGVIEYEVPEPTVRLTGIQTGQYNLINDIPFDKVSRVEKDPKLRVHSWFPICWAFLNFNHAVKPFDDPRVRKALDLMVDKPTLLKGTLWGNGVITGSPSFPASPSRNRALEPRKQDFAAAKALLKEAGIGPGELTFTFKVTTNYPWMVEAAEIMQGWFEQGDLKVGIQKLTWADWLGQCWQRRDFQVTMMNFFTLWQPDFLYFSIWNSKGAFNYRNIKDPMIDKWTLEARHSTDAAERIALYKKVQKQIQDETHDVILWYRKGTLAAQPRVGGLDKLVHPDGSNFQFKNVWLNA
ncbi:MAG: ABC transporter substrate-binding protein [Acetobacteraceae bacterium]